ncbi:hypothetical protein PUN28_004477 [Cardiocondyla obscurior]|uniref:Uncharacterized protein n=1 Tax=Cardiocondyla obscurior TaxID=286306 RepID=A0AAW2GCU6_9HYME
MLNFSNNLIYILILVNVEYMHNDLLYNKFLYTFVFFIDE